jgi:hypothetical protein
LKAFPKSGDRDEDFELEMFFHLKKLKKNLLVDPKDYGPDLEATIKRKLVAEVRCILPSI